MEGSQQCRAMSHHGLCVALITTLLTFATLVDESEESFTYPPTMVKVPPQQQLYQVSRTSYEQDKPFILFCEAEGNPEPEYSWIKDGLEFDYAAHNERISQNTKSGSLIFTKPDDVDEGLYQCFAKNVHGTALSNSVSLRKAELNSTPVENVVDEIYASEGDPLTIPCTSNTNYPDVTLFWVILSHNGALKNLNNSRITVDPEGNLNFSNVTLEDDLNPDMYVCVASSSFRVEYKFVKRIVLKITPRGPGEFRHPPTKQYASQLNIVALRGQKLELSCIYGGTPLPNIVWKKYCGSLSSNRYNFLNFGKTIVVRKVDFQDKGTYECTASNGEGDTQTQTMTVTVQSAPYWITIPNNFNGFQKETVKFECSAKGVPAPKLRWLVNGVPLEKAPPNKRRTVDGNVLVFKDLVRSDTAVYQCNASNVHGYAFKNVYLNVWPLHSTTDKQEPIIKVIVTSDVVLKCAKPGANWMKDGRELSEGNFKVLKSGDLEIKNVLRSDQGNFSCYASNQLKASWKLEVKDKTRIVTPPESLQSVIGKSATFRCNSDGDPSLDISIQWLFNGQPIDFNLDPRMVKSIDDSLIIIKTRNLDNGEYTCVAKSELDQDTASATLTVQDIPNPPRVVNVTCNGRTALVEWQPTGDGGTPILHYSIQWNTSFTPDTWVEVLSNISASDTKSVISMSPWANYTFRVIAINSVGPSFPSEHSEICTAPEDVPHKNPEKVRGGGSKVGNLVISWIPMPPIEQNAPGFFYKVSWRRNDLEEKQFETGIVPNWETNEYIVKDLETFKPYRIKVEAYNSEGQANIAAVEVIGYSGEDVPKVAPRNFKLLKKQGPNYKFSWEAVPPDSIRGHFEGYKIRTWTSEQTENQFEEQLVSSNVTETLVTIIKPFSFNKVKVLAFNKMYDGPPSDTIELVTAEETPGPVSAFDAIPMGSSAFYLVWKKPVEPNGVLTGYRIFYQEVIGIEQGALLELRPQITNTNETRAKLTGLKPNTKYRLIIKATTRAGEGEGYFIEAKTKDISEISPDFVWYELLKVNRKPAVKVTWIPAVEGRNGSHFYVQYKKKGAAEWLSTPMVDNRDTVDVLNLEPATIYNVKVVIVDGPLQTERSVDEIETEEQPSGTVFTFEATPVGSSAFYLDWKKPLKPNGVITGYHISYQEVNGTDLGPVLEITNPNETRAKLGGLRPNTKYVLAIKAKNKAGLGDEYIIDAKTNVLSATPPVEPKFILCQLPNVRGEAGVKVTWIPAATGNAGSYFYVQYQKKGSMEWLSTPMVRDRDTVDVLNLEPATIYKVKVVAVDWPHQTSSKVIEIETEDQDFSDVTLEDVN